LDNLQKDIHPILFVTCGYSLGKEEPVANVAQLGHLSMATLLYQHGYNVRFLSGNFIEPHELISLLKQEKIGIVAFYTTSEDIFRIMALTAFIKDCLPETLVFLGGPHVSIEEKDKDMEALEKCPADLVARGEGEYILLSLVEYYYEKKGSLSEIKGITYRAGTELRRNPDAPLIKNLDELPIPCRELLDPATLKLERMFPRILTGRSCPFKCAFCFDGVFGRTYRVRSVEKVLEEVDYILDTCPGRVISFLDNTFTVSAERIRAICRGLRARRDRGYDFLWTCLGRVNVLAKNLTLIDEMVDAGLMSLQVGVESGDPEVLRLYNKKITKEEIEKVISHCNKAGLPTVVYNAILGGPLESPETYRTTLDFCKHLLTLAPGRAFCSGTVMLSPYPMTAIAEDPGKYGLKVIDPEFKRGLSVQKIPFTETEAFDRYELVRLLYKFEDEIRYAIKKLYPSIPRDVILKHIEIAHRYGNISFWLSVFRIHPGINKFYNLLRYSLFRDYYDIPAEDLLNWYPLRTFELMYNQDNLCVVDGGDGKDIVMDNFESFLYEYSGGKMPLREIMDMAGKKFSLSEETLFKRTINFYRHMADKFAVIFSRV